MRKQSRYTLLAVLAVLVALAVALYLRWKAPPEVARLLPESDAMVYVSLKPLRAATHFDRTSVARSASYQQFVDATGIVAERDLDSAAFALHRMSNPNGANGLVAFSEVFEGRFDHDRLAKYLASAAANKETYADRTIYAIPSEGRTLRVVMLGYDMIAASNMPTPEQIHSIVDRERAGASPFAGSSLLSARYSEVPAFSSIWGIGRIGLPFSEGGRIQVMGMQLPVPADATFVASLQGFKLKIDEITASDGDALQSAAALTQLLGLFQAMQPEARTPEDKAVKQFVDSVKIEQKKSRAEITALLPGDALMSAFMH
ncbi:hypothetical protein [Granulicella tundricola]|uniref:Uncharacterized protein n=1 Tax=Granulicella tundricola (strain ATCC BAA-1859 / DSM 23138 / MP5ACTX9) TaxID=1198114 RepID=E8X1R3_GRATM|nr:hypothetical protein [Granulicella tundricola]ADW67982.1 hypothetical protein AciX9_0915 [Granulicella tundricola MP5ACTX9]